MLLKLTHQTDLTYSDLISESVMELRMAPRQEQDQHRLSFTLAIGPATSAFSYFDWLGNSVHAFTVNSFHNQIRIVATSVVETDRAKVQPERFADRWPVHPDMFDYQMWDYLQFGGPILDSPSLRELVAVLRPEEGLPLGELALRILHLLADRFRYRKGVTNAASPISEILEHGSGVCQDFTHLMIAMARALRIPARYVSGMIHPDHEKYRGFTQTHAWCELYFPSAGWIGFDPANNCIVGHNFVKVAVGRHFGDVSPNRGIYRGSANESIEVSVHSEELRSVPPELAAERVQSIAIPTYPGGTLPHQDLINQQQEQQQQQ
ncbi:MAG TPA: transglutaminase family protein [Tepidisphaeraceae bacterium]|nr:transglutaminase family protein [Tepidisphaeraceae bacterium]